MTHQRPLGELRGPTGPAVRDVEGWVKMGKLVLPLWAADWPWEALFLSLGCIRRFEYNLMIRGVAGGGATGWELHGRGRRAHLRGNAQNITHRL